MINLLKKDIIEKIEIFFKLVHKNYLCFLSKKVINKI